MPHAELRQGAEMQKKKKPPITKKYLYEQLLDRILFLDYPPGTVLNEKQLIDEFCVSRMPLREVLKRLEWEQLVITMPRMGTIVTEVKYGQVIQVFQARIEIEEFAGRLAAQNITDEHLNQIREIGKNVVKLINGEQIDRRRLIKADVRFREVIYDAAGNPILSDISQYLYNLTVRFHSLVFQETDWDHSIRTLGDEINDIHQVLSERDPIKTGRIRKKFLRENVERVKKKL